MQVTCVCGKVIHVPNDFTGSRVRCRACGAISDIVPEPISSPVVVTEEDSTPPLSIQGDPEEPPVAYVDIPRPATKIVVNAPAREPVSIPGEDEPWFYQFIEAIGIISGVSGGLIIAGLFLGLVSAMDHADKMELFSAIWKPWATVAIALAGNWLGCLATVDLLRNVWRIRVKIGS